MNLPVSRRTALKTMALAGMGVALPTGAVSARSIRRVPSGWVRGKLSGAEALVETLKVEGCHCVFGIPGAQENELWDAFKSRGLDYLLCTHEFSAAVMADGYARATGEPGVCCVVPGPGVTNTLTGVGEALLDSIPLVVIAGDVAKGDKYRPFQVHELPQAELLRPVTKGVFEVKHESEIPDAVRKAFMLARCGEPGPAAVVVPYNYLLKSCRYDSPPLEDCALPLDEEAFRRALGVLSCPGRVGIYAGLGCMDYGATLVQAAEMLNAPVATSVSGKGVIDDKHPLSVGWGYGPQGTATAEDVFKAVDTVLAIGVRYSEVSTGFYSIPKNRNLIHVDINPKNIGQSVQADVCVNADAGVFLSKLLEHADDLRRPSDDGLYGRIRKLKAADEACHAKLCARCGTDPMALVQALRRCTRPDALVFVDVTLTEHLAAEAFPVYQPRTYFNPTDNQSMGWSIPAALGAQKAHPGRQVVTITGDGCMLMSAMEFSTAARACLPVKFFVLDDQAYHYMQVLQQAAYKRTTATVLGRIDYEALAKATGLAYFEIKSCEDLEPVINGALEHPGPVLTRVISDYGKRKIRWIEATKKRFTDELSTAQKARFATRLGARSAQLRPWND
jgi:acetolactate synthase-1/2/3 large subunit